MGHRLVLGGASSGKSSAAERPLLGMRTLYVATGPQPDPHDRAWQDRVQRHRERRPAHWGCVETSAVAQELTRPGLASQWDSVLVDSVTTLVSAWVDEANAWEDPAAARALVERRVTELTEALRACQVPVVLVSDEVGLGGVAAEASARLFADLLGRANAALARLCEEAVLVVAGTQLPLPPHTESAPIPKWHDDTAPPASSATPWRDAWRLSVGTFTRWPVAPPSHIDAVVAGRAMLLAPIAVIPLAVGMALLVALGAIVPIPALAVGALAYAALVWATRLMHVDGLADTVDGLCVAHDQERALRAMKAPDVGPGGVVALLVSGLLQTSSLAYLIPQGGASAWAMVPSLWGVATAVLGSRWVVAWGCRRGIPSAHPTGLGATVAGSVKTPQVVATGLVLVLLAGVGGLFWAWDPVLVLVGVLAQFLAATLVLHTAVKRFGGITGDVLGAVIEVASTVGLLVVACATAWAY